LLVIPAKAGIQLLRLNKLDPGLRREDERGDAWAIARMRLA
jgi:hypothetical protein